MSPELRSAAKVVRSATLMVFEASQSITELSFPPVARIRPLGSKAAVSTESLCPIGWPWPTGMSRATTSPVDDGARPGTRKTVISPRRLSTPNPATATRD